MYLKMWGVKPIFAPLLFSGLENSEKKWSVKSSTKLGYFSKNKNK